MAPGKRSYNYRTNWNSGVQSDETGEYYFMTSGGAETAQTTTNPSKFTIKRQASQPGYEKIKIRKAEVALSDAGILSVSWEEDKTTTPPFSYHIRVLDNPSGRGKPLLMASRQVPHARSATLDISTLKVADGPYYLHLECVDILDRRSETKVLSIPSSGD